MGLYNTKKLLQSSEALKTVNKVKRWLPQWEKYLQHIHMINGKYPDYVKNAKMSL
jgi:hypothetical protein